jgi:hypothetical protein
VIETCFPEVFVLPINLFSMLFGCQKQATWIVGFQTLLKKMSLMFMLLTRQKNYVTLISNIYLICNSRACKNVWLHVLVWYTVHWLNVHTCRWKITKCQDFVKVSKCLSHQIYPNFLAPGYMVYAIIKKLEILACWLLYFHSWWVFNTGSRTWFRFWFRPVLKFSLIFITIW